MCANGSSNCSTENNEVCICTDILPGYRCDCRTGYVNETGTCTGNCHKIFACIQCCLYS